MRRIAGNVLIGLSIVLTAATLLRVVVEILEAPRNPNEDQQGLFVVGLLLAAVLLILAVVL